MLLIDFETASLADVKRVKGRNYAIHSSTRVLCMCWLDTDTGREGIWVPADWGPLLNLECVRQLPDFNNPIVVAHNADGFDRWVWERFVGQPVREWIDTLYIVRMAGLPGKLDEAARALKVGQKLMTHKQLHKISTVKQLPNGRLEYTAGKPGYLRAIALYCQQDVRLMAELVKPYLMRFWDMERNVIEWHRDVNFRGCRVDFERIERLTAEQRHIERCAFEKLNKLTDGQITVENFDRLRAWQQVMRKFGYPHAVLDRKTLTEWANSLPSDHPAREIVQCRLEINRNNIDKLQAIREQVSPDGVLRDIYRFYGAHTGRFSSPFHSLPKGKSSNGERTSDDIAADIRGVLLPSDPKMQFFIADFSAIEPRVFAWLTNDRTRLQMFDPQAGDFYKNSFNRMFGIPVDSITSTQRDLAKMIELGLSYGTGADKFAELCARSKIDLSKLGLTAFQCVKLYRETYRKIPLFWQSLQRAAIGIANNQYDRQRVGRIELLREGDCLMVRLPSGRMLVYREITVEEDDQGRLGLLYKAPHKTDLRRLWGSLMAENIVQAVSRDVFVSACIRLNQQYPVHLHAHDEIVVGVEETTSDVARSIMSVMCEPPIWATGLPLAVEGFFSERFSKSGKEKYKHATQNLLNG